MLRPDDACSKKLVPPLLPAFLDTGTVAFFTVQTDSELLQNGIFLDAALGYVQGSLGAWASHFLHNSQAISPSHSVLHLTCLVPPHRTSRRIPID